MLKIFYKQILELFIFYRSHDVRLRLFGLATICSFLAVFFNILSLRLLVPLIHTIISAKNIEGTETAVVSFDNGVFSDKYLFIAVVAGAVFLASLFKNLLEYIATRLSTKQAAAAELSLKALTFKRFLLYSKSFTDQKSLGYLNNALMRHTTTIAMQIVSLQKLFGRLFALGGYLVVLVYISWQMTLITLTIIPVSHLLIFKLSSRIRQRSNKYTDLQTSLSKHAIEIIFCIPIIKTFSKELKERKKFNRANKSYLKSQLAVSNLENIIPQMRDFLTMSSLLLVVLTLPLVENIPCSSQRASELILFFLILRISMPSINAIHDLHIIVAKTQGPLNNLKRVLEGRKKWELTQGKEEFKGLKNNIRIKNFSFKMNGRIILDQVNLEVKRGEKVAIIGESGAGKSTLANILMRMYEIRSKRIFFDEVDIRKFNIQSLRSKIGYIDQNVIMFDTSIRENLIYSANDPNDITEEKIQQILEQTKLTSLIHKSPEGLETRVGLSGKLLSGGEKTRLALARMLLHNPDIIIFDEATASLDNITRKEISDLIHESCKNKTSIHILHNLSEIMKFDKIFIMENGKISESGTPEELINKNTTLSKYLAKG